MDGQDETAEERRLREARVGVPWRRWGPYLSERQWGTVREDYSESGDAWNATIEHVAARLGMTPERIVQILASAREKRDR